MGNAQYTNTIYVLNGDSKNLSSVYIYDVTTASWTTQAVDAGSFNTSSFTAILDHNTNVLCASIVTSVPFFTLKPL